MRGPNPSRAILAGFVATLVMTMIMYVAPAMGMPKMDIAAMLGSMLSSQMPAPYSGAWWSGLLLHFINGTIIFPLIYGYLLYTVLPGAAWAKGLTCGIILWFLAQIMVMPMMGMGVLSSKTPQPMMSVAGSLIGHVIYGLILGAIAGDQALRAGREHEQPHAA